MPHMLRARVSAPSGTRSRLVMGVVALLCELDAHTYAVGLMKDAGLTARIDAAGNVFGRREGSARPEYAALMLQNATSEPDRGSRRKLPLVFTEHGAIMAATVLNSPRGVEMSV
jgi:hypothetical protein